MSNPTEKSIWSEVPVEENVDLNGDKSDFSDAVYSIFLKKIGLDPVDPSDHVQRKAYDFMKWLIEEDKQVLLGFWVCPYYYAYLRRLLKNSYNCYRDSNDPEWSNDLFNEHFTIVEILKNNGVPYDKFGLVVKDYKEIDDMKKFDLTVMNPPYEGEGTPLYMEIAKVIYDNCLTDEGKLVSINPTSIQDSVYDGIEKNSRANMTRYGDMKVEEYEYDPSWMFVFGQAKIGNGICVTTYSKKGKHTLWDDYVRGVRFGKKNWEMRKTIIAKIRSILGDIDNKGVCKNSVADIKGFYSCSTGGESKVAEINNKNSGHLVVLAYNRGNTGSSTNKAWDWVTLQSPDYLKVVSKAPVMRQYGIFFKTKKESVDFIKWTCTDLVGFVVKHYKSNISNALAMFGNIPKAPGDNYSDEVLMKHFNLTQEEMDWIHSEMKNFGWKVSKDVNLTNHTEAELMAYIDEINK